MKKIFNLIRGIRKSNKLLTILVLFFIALIYLLFAADISKNIFQNSSFPYYTYLINALGKGHLDIISPTNIDLSIFNGKLYLNWGPGPILFILPFYLLTGGNASDIFYTLFAGIANIFLLHLVIDEFKKYFKLSFSKFAKFFILLTFAFCSPNFYLSLGGRIWATEQIISTFYILVFLLFFLKFLNSKLLGIKFLFLSVLFFNLAWFTRATMVFYGLLFFYIIFILYKKQNIKSLKNVIFIVASITVIFGSIFLTYNFLRFGNPLETGLTYHNGNPRYVQELLNKEIFSFSYVPFNVQHYFLEPAYLTFQKPYVNLNLEGNSVFFVYPVFILFLFLFQKKYLQDKNISRFLYFSLLIIILNLVLLMMYFATGWTQVGSRYVLDVIPLISLLSLLVVKDIPKPLLLLLFLNAALINIFGAFIFYNF
jgi:hypothetical protein